MTDVATENAGDTVDDGAEVAGPDPDWTARCRRRLRAALAVLAEQDGPIRMTELQELAADRVPLTAYDRSTPKSSGPRGPANLAWNLTTTYTHAGWLYGTSGAGVRITVEGRRALDEYPDPEALYTAGVERYYQWDAARADVLPAPAGDPRDRGAAPRVRRRARAAGGRPGARGLA